MPSTLSPDAEKVLAKEIATLRTLLEINPQMPVPTPGEIAHNVSETCHKDVNERQARLRLKKGLGIPLYKLKYGSTVAPAVSAFLLATIAQIKVDIAANPNIPVKNAEELTRDCKVATKEKVTSTTVRDYLLRVLGKALYKKKYGKGISAEAEAFLSLEIAQIRNQWLRSPDNDFPTAVDLKNKLEREKHIIVVPRTIRKRLKAGLGADIYAQIYGRNIPPAASSFFTAEVEKIHQQWVTDPDGDFASPQALATQCKDTCQINVSAHLVRKYLRIYLGEDLYRKIYWFYLDPDVEDFLATEISAIRELWGRNPQADFPTPQQLAERCSAKLNKVPSISAIRMRLLQQLDSRTYTYIFGRDIPPEAEQFLTSKIQAILAQYRQDPLGDFPTTVDIQQKLEQQLKIRVNLVSIRTRLRNQIEKSIYLDIFGREVPVSVKTFLNDEIEKIRAQWYRDPDGYFPTLENVANRCIEGNHGTVSTGAVRKYFQQGLGSDLYDVLYNKNIAPEAEHFLSTEAKRILAIWKSNPNAKVPLLYEIADECRRVTSKKVSHYSVSVRFKEILGEQIYQTLFNRSPSPAAEIYLALKISRIRSQWERDPFGHFPSAATLSRRCKAKFHKDISQNTVRSRLYTQLGTDIYNKIYGLGIDPAVNAFLTTEAARINTIYATNRKADVPTTEDLLSRCKRELQVNISDSTVHDRLKKYLGEKNYALWSATQRERAKLGLVNHKFFETLLLRGYANVRAQYPQLPPGFFEVQLSPEARCDIVLSDVYAGGYLRDCLARSLPDGRTWADVLDIPLEAADQYVDIRIDLTTRFSTDVVGEKGAKYCDGKILLLVACTGQYFPGVYGPVRHLTYPDALGLPVAAVAEFLQLPPKFVYMTYGGVTYTIQKERAQLEALSRDIAIPNAARFGSKSYARYLRQRDPEGRKVAEARALQARAKILGQKTLHEYGLDACNISLSSPEFSLDLQSTQKTSDVKQNIASKTDSFSLPERKNVQLPDQTVDTRDALRSGVDKFAAMNLDETKRVENTDSKQTLETWFTVMDIFARSKFNTGRKEKHDKKQLRDSPVDDRESPDERDF